MHFAWLKYFKYHLISVMAPNYKQHILLLAIVRKVCYSLVELCRHICLFQFIWVEGDMTFMQHCKGDTSYRSLGTSAIDWEAVKAQEPSCSEQQNCSGIGTLAIQPVASQIILCFLLCNFSIVLPLSDEITSKLEGGAVSILWCS
jgi:hypothetical protein